MSLESIISQLQSIQPRSKVSAESLSSDILKTRNSIIRLARLLQNSGKSTGNRYTPNKSSTSTATEKIEKTINKSISDLNKLSTEHKKFKAFTQRSFDDVLKQIKTLRRTNERNSDVLKSVQTELGFGRPQRTINASLATSASQVPSYGRTVRAQLNRLNQQVAVLNATQQKIVQDVENTQIGRQRAGGVGLGIVGRAAPLPFKQRLNYFQEMQAQDVARSAVNLPGIGGNKAFFAALAVTLAAPSASAGTKSFTEQLKKLNQILSKENIQDVLDDLAAGKKGATAGTPYLEGTDIKIKGAMKEPKAATEFAKKEKELIDLLTKEKDEAKKKDYLTKIEDIKKQRLEILKSAGIVTPEHVTANLAKPEDVKYYQWKNGEAIQYIDSAVVKEFPEIWQADDKGFVTLKPDWKEAVKTEAAQKKIKEKTESIARGSTLFDTPIASESLFGGAKSYEDVPFENVKEMIMKAEGTAGDDPYNIVYGYGEYAEPDKDITSMKISELMAFQEKLIAATKGKVKGVSANKGTSAVGAYQITMETLKDLAPKVLGENWESIMFTPEIQDKLAKALYEQRRVSNKSLSSTWAFFRNLDEEGGKALREQVGGADVPAAPILMSGESAAAAESPTAANVVQTIREELTAENQTEDAAKQKIMEETKERTEDALVRSIAAEMSIHKLADLTIKNTKELNGIREMVRQTAGYSDFAVKDPRFNV